MIVITTVLYLGFLVNLGLYGVKVDADNKAKQEEIKNEQTLERTPQR